jgi:prepilin-type processing-associated H-X9-DG protein
MKLQNRRSNPGLARAFVKRNEAAFSRVDLLTVFSVITILGVWFGFAYSGERGHILNCAGNLAVLGKAMQNYANEHDDMLPPAQIWLQKAAVSWDAKIFPYLSSGRPKVNDDSLFAKSERLFLCPSDPAPHHGIPRSYAMGANDMSPENWPPGPASATGVGLWWDGNTTPRLLGVEAMQKPESLPGTKLSALPAPADTLLLTELIDSQNQMGSIDQTVVWGIVSQQSFFKNEVTGFHHGKFNYLMVDGHVELLSSLQTGSLDHSAGIWTIRQGD